MYIFLYNFITEFVKTSFFMDKRLTVVLTLISSEVLFSYDNYYLILGFCCLQNIHEATEKFISQQRQEKEAVLQVSARV